MSNQLSIIFQRQRAFQELLGFDFENMTDEARMAYIRDQNLALQDELHEVLAETGWKPWASSNHINRDAYLGEMVDALHFFVNLALIADITPEELFAGYMKKINRNILRQAEGYDGVAGKCPQCKRAIDDVHEHGQSSIPMNGMEFCSSDCVVSYNHAAAEHEKNTSIRQSMAQDAVSHRA